MLSPDSLSSFRQLCDRASAFWSSRTCGPTATPTARPSASRSACARWARMCRSSTRTASRRSSNFCPAARPARKTRRARAGPRHHRRRLRRPEAPRRGLRCVAARARREHRSSRQQSRLRQAEPRRCRVARHRAGHLRIISALKWPLTPEIAANLYVGLMTDTGSFRYRQTTADTFEVAAQLVAAGADPTDLAEAATTASAPSGCCSLARCSTPSISRTRTASPGFLSRPRCTRAAARSPTKARA